MKALGALLGTLFAALAIPFALLNMFSGIVAGVWLAILGEWSTIFLGLAILLIGTFAVSILLLPGMGLAAIGVAALDRGNKLVGWFCMLLASPWTYIVIIVWEVTIFFTFERRSTEANSIPIWLWSYGAATGVWTYMASREQQGGDGGGALAAAFGAQIAYMVFTVCIVWLRMPLDASIAAMALPLLLPLAVGLIAIGLTNRQS